MTTEVFFNNANYADSHCTTPNTTFTQLTIPPVITEYCKAFEFYCAVNRPELTRIYALSNTTKVSLSYCTFRALCVDLQILSVPKQTLFYRHAFYS